MVQNLKKKQFFVSRMTRIWWILNRALKILKNCTFISPFRAKYITFDLKKERGAIFHDTEEPSKFWRKTDLWHDMKNYMKNLANFHQNTWKCQNWYFYIILLSKVENAWGINFQTSLCNDNEKWWNIWRGTNLLFQNWQNRFDEFWLENSKVSKV